MHVGGEVTDGLYDKDAASNGVHASLPVLPGGVERLRLPEGHYTQSKLVTA